MSTLTQPLTRPVTPDAREVSLAVINRVLPTYAAFVHAPTTTAAELRHEAERLEALPRSPVIRSMRAYVDGERAWRRHLTRLGGRG